MVQQGVWASIDVDIRERRDLLEGADGMIPKDTDQVVDVLRRTVMEQERILAILNQSVADQTLRIAELTSLLQHSRTMLNGLGMRYHMHEPLFAEIGERHDPADAIPTSFTVSSAGPATPHGIRHTVGEAAGLNQSIAGVDLPTLEAMADLQEMVLTVTEENFQDVRKRIEDFPVELRADAFASSVLGWDLRANPWIGRMICSLPDLAVPFRQGPCTELAEAVAIDDVLGVRRTLPLDAICVGREMVASCFPSSCCSPLIGAHALDVVRILDELPNRSFMAVRSRRLARRRFDGHELDFESLAPWLATAGSELLGWVAGRIPLELNSGAVFQFAISWRNAALFLALLRTMDQDFAFPEFAGWPFAFRNLWGNRAFLDEALTEALRYASDPWTIRVMLAAGAEPSIEQLIEVASEPLSDAETVRALSAEISARAGGTAGSPIVGSRVLCRVCGGHLVSEECVRALLETGAGVGEADEEGMTPLMVTAAAGRPDLVRLLLSFGADVDQRTDLGTALHFAANADVAAALARAGASPRLCDKHGRTPLQLAIEWEVLDVQRVIGEMSRGD